MACDIFGNVIMVSCLIRYLVNKKILNVSAISKESLIFLPLLTISSISVLGKFSFGSFMIVHMALLLLKALEIWKLFYVCLIMCLNLDDRFRNSVLYELDLVFRNYHNSSLLRAQQQTICLFFLRFRGNNK